MGDGLAKKIPVEILADRLTRWFVPAIFLIAGGTGLYIWMVHSSLEAALLRGLTVLVISCPCALGIATPIVKVAAVGIGRRQGILVRDPGALELVKDIDTLVFDKTGTLTDGNFDLQEIYSEEGEEKHILSVLGSVETHSALFLARTIVRKAQQAGVNPTPASLFEEIEGLGVKGVTAGKMVMIGSRPFLKQAGLPTAPLKWDDFGATFGGPILKDKLHFFVPYEKNKDDRSDVRSGFVPSTAEKAGDFSGAPLAGCTPDVPIDPLTGQPFPGNVIPANRMSPAGLAFLKLYQLPTLTPSSGCNNYVQAVPTPIHWNQINARVDWNVNNSTRVMVRYTQDSWKADDTNLGGDSPLSVVGSTWDQPGRSLVAQLNRAIGSNMTNTLTFSYSANVITTTRVGDSAVVDQINSVLPTVYPASMKEAGGTAQPFFWGAGPYGYLWNQAPWKNNQSLYVLKPGNGRPCPANSRAA